MSTSGPRSLSQWLREQPDEALGALLRDRPDLAVPPPGDLGTLASRIGVRFSVLRALENLDAFALGVLDGLVLLADDGPVRYEELAALLPAGPERAAVRRAVDRMRELALVWGDDEGLHPVSTVRELLGSYPAGLGRPAAALLAAASSTQLAPVLATLGLRGPGQPGIGQPAVGQPEAGAAIAAVLADPARLRALLDRCGEREREVLGQLAAGPPLGTVRDAMRPVFAEAADSPVRWLLAHGLLVAIDVDTVELPREVGLALRGDQPLGPLRASPPELSIRPVDPSIVDSAGAGQVLATLRLVETLLESYAADPPPVLRSGGLGVRELRRTAKLLDGDEPTAALLLELVREAGLLDSTSTMEPVWLPTVQYDPWLALPVARRWVRLAQVWLDMTRLPGLVGQRDDRDKPVAALSVEVERTGAPGTRRRALSVLAGLAPGEAVAPAEVAERLAWLGPRRGGQRSELVTGLLAEADVLGVTGRSALTSYGRVLLAGNDPTEALTARLPEPVDHVLVQTDLTVVAPGPLEPDLGREMALVAEVESAGGATVYRVTDGTVRRALDAGRTAAELHELFRTRSRTPVPQALTYLVDDVARRHGALRAGAASSYLRCDDEALLAQAVADRRLESLRLRRIAPTVAAARVPVSRVLDLLRQSGYAPVAESAEGTVEVSRPDARRAPVRPVLVHGPVEPAPPTEAQLAELVRAIRAGDRAARESRRVSTGGLGEVPGVTTAATLGLLRQALREGRRVWIGYVNAQGAASQRIVEPISIAGGYLHGFDHDRAETRTFALHRITRVALLDEGSAAKGAEPGF
jgi:Helicase conserved C-terminal domain/WYL domain